MPNYSNAVYCQGSACACKVAAPTVSSRQSPARLLSSGEADAPSPKINWQLYSVDFVASTDGNGPFAAVCTSSVVVVHRACSTWENETEGPRGASEQRFLVGVCYAAIRTPCITKINFNHEVVCLQHHFYFCILFLYFLRDVLWLCPFCFRLHLRNRLQEMLLCDSSLALSIAFCKYL
jgi:hypothetical protein